MRKLSELIVLVRGGGDVGSAIAHRLYRSNFRICITEIDNPLAVNRGICFSEAIYDSTKVVEGVMAERTSPSLEHIYRVWRKGNIPIIVDPELTVKPLIKPDVLVNAMMLRRKTNTRINDAHLVIGIGSGFTIGDDVHLLIGSENNNDLGKVICQGEIAENPEEAFKIGGIVEDGLILAEDAGVFTTRKNIGDMVTTGDIIGKLNNSPLEAPISGNLRGLLRNDAKVLANTRLAEINPDNDKSACYAIDKRMRAIAGGVLEAIMISLNVDDTYFD